MKFARLLSLILLEQDEDDEVADISALQYPSWVNGMMDVYLNPYWAGQFKCVHLNMIRVKKDAPKGLGTAYMEKLCEMADKWGWVITLNLGSKGDGEDQSGYKRTTSSTRLHRFYTRFGFKKNASRGMFQLRGTRHRMPLNKQ